MVTSSSPSTSTSTGVAVSGTGTGTGTGTTSGSGVVASGGGGGGTQHVDVPGIQSAATRFTGFTENLDAVRCRMDALAQEVPTKGGVDAAWTQFQTGGYAQGTRDLTDAVYSVAQLIQGLHDGLITAARTLQQGEDDNAGATARLKDSMSSIRTALDARRAPESEPGQVRAVRTAPAPVERAQVVRAQPTSEQASVADGRAGEAAH